MIFFKIILAFFIFSVNIVYANNMEEGRHADSVFKSSIYFMIGPAFGASASDFFEDYRKYIGGYYSDFLTQPAFCTGTKFFITDNIRAAAALSYIFSSVNESYTLEFESTMGRQTRLFSQKMDIQSIPVILSAEYFPYEEQFKTYIGAGAGLCYTKFKWKERVYSTLPEDKRTGGTWISEKSVFPAFRVFAAIDLGFDKPDKDSFVGSLIFEMRFTYFFREYKMFSEAAAQLEEKPDNHDRYYTIIPYYLGLNLGVSFNFVKKYEQNLNNQQP